MAGKSRWLLAVGVIAGATLLTSAAPAPKGEISPAALRLLDPSTQMLQMCGRGPSMGARLREQVRLAMVQAQPERLTPAASAPPPLLAGLASVHQPVSTRNAKTQAYFDQGLALLYGFNHAEAIRYFQEARRLDPGCAICAWGEAFAYGPNINAPMDPDVNARAMNAAGEALALKQSASPAEQALIDAVAIRYSADPKADRVALDKEFAQRMLDTAQEFPDHDMIAVLAAEALMDTQPWDYWEADRRTPKGQMGTAIALVENVLARNPEHPQGNHLYIHLLEASVNAGKAESAADRLAKPLVPAAGHLVHMPGHLYYRVGRFKDAIRVNVEAARVDEAFLATSQDAGIYRFGYYPHNVHFLVTSAQMAGDGGLAISQARKLSKILNTDVTAAMPWVQPVDAAMYLAYAQFAAPADILALASPDARLPYVIGMWHYARAVAYAQQGDAAGAGREIAAIRKIRQTTDFTAMETQLVPASDLLQLAETVAQARLAYARGKYPQTIALYRDAVRLEDGIRYMEPPFWYFPVRQSLGAALYKTGDYKAARQTFMDALAEAPNNGWALYGLMATQRALGDKTGAAATEAAFENAWAGDRRWLNMDRL
ncbi:MAG: tetratricopeptide repeat protein [Sphingomonadaceae bacterium]